MPRTARRIRHAEGKHDQPRNADGVLWVAHCLAVFWLAVGSSSCQDTRDVERVVFFGDSLTNAGNRPGGFIDLLRKVAAANHRPVELINAGISGNKVTDLVSRLNDHVLVHRPKIVIVYVGINDAWHWFIPGLKGTPKEVYRAVLTDIVDEITRRGAQVVLCTPSVIGENVGVPSPKNEMLDAYSDVVRDLAKARGLVLVDLRRRFVDHLSIHNVENQASGLLTNDEVHLTADGNRLVAAEIQKALGWPARSASP